MQFLIQALRSPVCTSAQGVAEAESRRAADAAEAAYREAFDRSVSADEGRLEAEHMRALAVANAVFTDNAIGAHALAVTCCKGEVGAAMFR